MGNADGTDPVVESARLPRAVVPTIAPGGKASPRLVLRLVLGDRGIFKRPVGHGDIVDAALIWLPILRCLVVCPKF